MYPLDMKRAAISQIVVAINHACTHNEIKLYPTSGVWFHKLAKEFCLTWVFNDQKLGYAKIAPLIGLGLDRLTKLWPIKCTKL
jgi:hypothetical protein